MRRETLRCAILLLIGVAPAAGQLELPRTVARLVQIDDQAGAVAHLVVVVDGRGQTFVRTAGSADVSRGIPCTDATLVPLGRLTRCFTDAGIAAAAQRGALGWDDALGDTVSGLPADVAALTWRALAKDENGGLPGYRRHVASLDAARPLRSVVRTHGFSSRTERPWREPGSMLPSAIAQLALEAIHGELWSEVLPLCAHELIGTELVRDARAAAAHMLVQRHRADGTPAAPWWAEVPAAAGAVAPAAAIARLARLALGSQPSALILRDAEHGVSPTHEVPFRQRALGVPGASGTLRVYADPDVAAFVFAARHDSATVDALHENVLGDLIHQGVQPEQPAAGIGLGGGVLDRDRTILGRWTGVIHHIDGPVPVEIVVALRQVRVGLGKGATPRLVRRVRRFGTAVRGRFEALELVLPGWTQETWLAVSLDGEALTGWATLRAAAPGVGEVEVLPYPVRLVRAGD